MDVNDVAISSDGTYYVSSYGVFNVFGLDLSWQRQWIGANGCLALDPTGQYLYTTLDIYMHKYRVGDGALVGSWQYAGNSPGIQLGLGVGPSGTVYTASDGYVQTFSADGTFLGHWQPVSPFYAGAVTVDTDEDVYVVAGAPEGTELQKYTRTGALIWRVATPPAVSGLLDLAVDGSRNIYIVCESPSQVLKFGYPAVPVLKHSWGQLKRHYR
jgi:sugar lactone lactonase YvrE